MRNKSFYRGILIIAGFLAAAVIVFSHAASSRVLKAEKKATTEQTDKQESKTTINAPDEALTVSAVQVDEQAPDSLLEVLPEPEADDAVIPTTKKLAGTFLRTLFRVVISPNAP